jgi:hypothetical protein
VDAAGTDCVTLTNPLLLQLVKRHYPRLEVKVSAFANVASPMQARFWSDLGADVLTLSPILANREFGLLSSMAGAFPGKLQVVVNNNCLASCPFYAVHTANTSHGSQSWHWSRGYQVDYCGIGCRLLRLSNPVLFIKGDWIRPEDVHHYERVGVRQIKIVNRTNPTDVIVERVQAYARRRYDGSFLDLIEQDHRTQAGRFDLRAKLRIFQMFFRPLFANPRRLASLRSLAFPAIPFVEIPNRELDGFLDRFVAESCMLKSCERCGHCDQVARRVLRIDGERYEEYRGRYRQALDGIIDGRLFDWP